MKSIKVLLLPLQAGAGAGRECVLLLLLLHHHPQQQQQQQMGGSCLNDDSATTTAWSGTGWYGRETRSTGFVEFQVFVTRVTYSSSRSRPPPPRNSYSYSSSTYLLYPNHKIALSISSWAEIELNGDWLPGTNYK